MKNKLQLIVKNIDRIDRYIAQNSSLSRTDVQRLINHKAIAVGNIVVRKASFQVRVKQSIMINQIIPKKINALPENIPIDVVYEDDDIIVINKKSGVVVHPAPGNASKTLVNALLFRFQNLSNVNGPVRPGIVHRIDKDTSGLLVVAKHNEAHINLAQQIKEHKVKRAYLCWVKKRPQDDITHLDLPIGRDPNNRKKMTVTKINSKKAITHIFAIKSYSDRTLLKCELETGRTHQIRVHLAYMKNPIIGDPVYGTSVDDFGQQLHAFELEFDHPITNKKMTFQANPPPRFLK